MARWKRRGYGSAEAIAFRGDQVYLPGQPRVKMEIPDETATNRWFETLEEIWTTIQKTTRGG
jgi:hypothetical protein